MSGEFAGLAGRYGHESVVAGPHAGLAAVTWDRIDREQGPYLPADPGPVQVTFVLQDADDCVAVKHDGQVVWQESSFDHLDQYLRFAAPKGVPVVIGFEEPAPGA